jgi:hypothetical protein
MTSLCWDHEGTKNTKTHEEENDGVFMISVALVPGPRRYTKKKKSGLLIFVDLRAFVVAFRHARTRGL